MNVKHFPSKKVLNLILQAKEYCLVSVQDFSGGNHEDRDSECKLAKLSETVFTKTLGQGPAAVVLQT